MSTVVDSSEEGGDDGSVTAIGYCRVIFATEKKSLRWMVSNQFSDANDKV